MTKARTLADNFAADINGITAGTGITGGGTSGTVTITNEMATTITAKGDLLAGTGNAAFDNLAAGASGETLVADSSATTGLRWQGDYAAGKNKIINGDFRINQRGFTSNTATDSFNFDRWFQENSGGTVTCTPQTFTPGVAPVAGYEGTTFLRQVTASQTLSSHYAQIRQKIESVRTFAGATTTLSFWAKAASGTPKITPFIQQFFGTGGSPSASVNTIASSITLSTSWARYSVTISVPSISGKTLGTANNDFLNLTLWTSAGSDYNSLTNSLGLQNNTFDFWGVQWESGSVATAFQTATGTLAGELAACKRYFEKNIATSTQGYAPFAMGYVNFATAANYGYKYEVEKRVQPTITFGPSVGQFMAGYKGNAGVAASTLTAANISKHGCNITLVPTGTPFTQGEAIMLQDAGSAIAYIEVSSEL